jgi:hypothetical protein
VKKKTFSKTVMVSIYIIYWWRSSAPVVFLVLFKRVDEEWGIKHEVKWSFRKELFTLW